jgi:hypothetical protein
MFAAQASASERAASSAVHARNEIDRGDIVVMPTHYKSIRNKAIEIRINSVLVA